MGSSVDLKKVEENDLFARYAFSSVNDEIGMVEIDKKPGRCKIIKKRNGDPENKLAYRTMWC